jgi:SARP family transcriptional regulator, regulator of embCAB operon
LESPTLRVYLAGRVSMEASDRIVGPDQFPGQQGRVAFAYLTAERGRPVTVDELAGTLWPEAQPPAWESALRAIMSKLRSLIAQVDTSGCSTLSSGRGYYELGLPPDTWVDIEAAADAIHDAEAALRKGNPALAYGPSAVAHHIARRPFLPGEYGPWIDSHRDRLRDILLRALDSRAEVYLWNNEHALALRAAKELISLEPLRESGHRLVMRAHTAVGNTAEALRAYEACRRLIARELGVDPSPQTKALYESVLQSV